MAKDLLKYGLVEEVDRYCLGNYLSIQFYNPVTKHPLSEHFSQIYPAGTGTSYTTAVLNGDERELTTILTSVETCLLRLFARDGYFDQQTIANELHLMQNNDISTYVSMLNDLLREVTGGKVNINNLIDKNIPGHFLKYPDRCNFIKRELDKNPHLFGHESLKLGEYNVTILTLNDLEKTTFVPKRVVIDGNTETIPFVLVDIAGDELIVDGTRKGVIVLKKLAEYGSVPFKTLGENILGREFAKGSALQKLKAGYNDFIELYRLAMGESIEDVKYSRQEAERRPKTRYKDLKVIFPHWI